MTYEKILNFIIDLKCDLDAYAWLYKRYITKIVLKKTK